MICKTIKIKKTNEQKNKTKMIAHRGLSGLERENSLRAFTAACNHNYYGSECDIHYTKDKVLVICHDDHTGRVSNDDMVIPESTFEELQKVRLYEFGEEVNSRDLYLPTFIEYLKIHKRYNKKCIVEIKCEITIDDAKEILEIIKPYYNLVTFISFNLNNLLLIRSLDEKIPIQYLRSAYSDDLIAICKENKFGIDILYKELTKERIETFKANEIIVNAWTVNDKDVAKELVKWGIDFITTNILE